MTRTNGKKHTQSGRATESFNPIASRRRASARIMAQLLECFGGELPSKASCDSVYDQAFCASGENFRATYLAAEAFSKFDPEDASTLTIRQQAAATSFLEGEAQCRATNRRLVWDPWGSQSVARVLRISQRLIADVLGDFDLEEFVLLCSHGSGATADLARAKSSPQNKWTVGTHTVTPSALPYALAVSQWFPNHGEELPGRNNGSFLVTYHDVLDSVNKDMARNRVIGKGPTMNVFFQKGIGKLHRRRLNRKGLLRKDAQEHHQRLARQGSLHGHLATVDLKNASSTIAYALVIHAYSQADPAWLTHMCALRANRWRWRSGHPDAGLDEGRYEMFSAMGNGFTFEMETLLFWSLTKAVCLVLGLPTSLEVLSVYGDDIICPVEAVPLLKEVFDHVGLTFNAKKSHWVGPFRESCGGHFYNGSEVTPFYIKKPVSSVVDLINVHNRVSLWLARGRVRDAGLEKVLTICRSAVPKKYWGPPGLAGTLWSPWHLSGAQWSRGRQSYSVCSLAYANSRQLAECASGALRYWFWSKRFGGASAVTDELVTEYVPEVDKGRVVETRLCFDRQRFDWAAHEAYLGPVYLTAEL